MLVDDKTINELGPLEVIEPLWGSVNIYDGEKEYLEGLTRWSKPQQWIFAIEWYQSEVNNGGHCQFFTNSAGIVWREAVEGLFEIGCDKLAKNLLKISCAYPDGFSRNHEERNAQLGIFESRNEYEAAYNQADDLFYELTSNDDLTIAETKYIKANRGAFYVHEVE